MSPLEFLRAVWPSEGLYCIATPFPKKGYDHRVFETIEAAAAYVETIKTDKNVFYATHTLAEPKVWDPHHHKDKATKEWVGDWRVRVQTNMRSSCEFFFDLDVDEDDADKYADQPAAINGLKSFVGHTGLPIPFIVSSGGGLHVHWIMDTEIPSSEWITTAARLKQLAQYFGLKIDTTRTTDTASVLRVVGTFNCKKEPHRAVESGPLRPKVSFTVFKEKIDAALEGADISPQRPKGVASKLSKLGDNLTPTFDRPPPTMVSLLKACPQMARIAEEESTNADEPEWYAIAGVLKFVKNGRAKFHQISQGDRTGRTGHPPYDPDTVDAKFDQWQTGPASCIKLMDACSAPNQEICKRCPWLVKAKYPVVAAYLSESAPPPTVTEIIDDVSVEIEIVNPPLPWKRTRDGGVVYLAETKEGRQYERRVFNYDIYPLNRASNVGTETETQHWRVHLPHGEIRDMTIDASTFVDDKQLRSRLAGYGVYTSNFEELKSYMSAYIQELQKKMKTSEQHGHLGWIEDYTKFVMPDRIFNPDGTQTTAHLNKIAAESKEWIGKKGTLAKQVELMSFYKDKRYAPQQMFILSSLASVIYFMTGHHGIVVHAQGESGASKSSAIYTAAALWGIPKKYAINCTAKGATEMSRANTIGVLNNLPACLDEITGISDDSAKDFALGATQPGGRKRAKNDGTPRASLTGDNRSSIILSTANVSLQSLLANHNSAGVAGAVRVFEMTFTKSSLLGVHTPMEADEYLLALFENYGHIGEHFIRVVTANLPKVKKAVLKYLRQLCIDGNVQGEERFWFAEAACALVAGDIAKTLGLLDYDLDYLRNWFLQFQLPFMRAFTTEQVSVNSPLTVLTDFLYHINGNTVVIETYDDRRDIVGVPVKPMGDLKAQFVKNTGVITVLKSAFVNYCMQKKRFSQEIIKDLAASGAIISASTKVVLGQGTDFHRARAECFTVNLNHPDLASLAPQLIEAQGPVKVSNVSKLRAVP